MKRKWDVDGEIQQTGRQSVSATTEGGHGGESGGWGLGEEPPRSRLIPVFIGAAAEGKPSLHTA